MILNNIKNLNNQTCLVVGANGGVGSVVAERLASLGATVYGIVRKNPSKINKVLKKYGSNHKVFIADITKAEDLKKISKEIKNLDIIINAAGYSKSIAHSNIEELSDEIFMEILNVNLKSVYSVIRTFVSKMNQSSNGLIINIGSASSYRTGGSNLAYAAAKAGLDSLTRNLALVLAPNIRINSINPSIMDTGFTDVDSISLEKIAQTTPLKRIATVDDVADLVESLCCHFRYNTGQCYLIDGGRLL